MSHEHPSGADATNKDPVNMEAVFESVHEDIASRLITGIANTAFSELPLPTKISALGALGISTHALIEKALAERNIAFLRPFDSEDVRSTETYKNFLALKENTEGDQNA